MSQYSSNNSFPQMSASTNDTSSPSAFLNRKRNLTILQRNYLIKRIISPLSAQTSNNDYESIANLFYLLMSFNWNDDNHSNNNKNTLLQNLRGNSLWFYYCSSYFPFVANELLDNSCLLPDIVNKYLIERQTLSKCTIYKKNSPSFKKEKTFRTVKNLAQRLNNNNMNIEMLINELQRTADVVHEINKKKITSNIKNEFILTSKYDSNFSYDDYIRMDMEYHSKTIGKFIEYIKTQNEMKNVFLDESDPDDVVCVVCNDGDYEDDNLIVYCSICHITVHQKCYGINVIPKDDWICQACKIYGSNIDITKNLECVLCPVKGGAMKPCTLKKTSMFYSYLQSMRSGNAIMNINCNLSTSTSDSNTGSVVKTTYTTTSDEGLTCCATSTSTSNGVVNGLKTNVSNNADSDMVTINEKNALEHAWVHLSCALWIPEIIISNYELKDKIKGFENIGKKRFMEKCDICLLKGYGPTIKCEKCDLRFHVECARVNKFQLESTDNQIGEDKFHLFCQKHAPHKLVKSRELRKQRELDDIKQYSKLIEKHIDIYNKAHKQSPLRVYNKTKGERSLIDLSSNQIKLNNKEKRLFISAIRNLIADLSNFSIEVNSKDFSVITQPSTKTSFSYIDTLTPMKFPWYFLKETEPYLQCFKPIEIFRLYKSIVPNESEYNKLILKKSPNQKQHMNQHSVKVKEKQVTYCYCHKNNESFMIGCEMGDKCPNNGWYHLECVDELRNMTIEEITSDKFGKYYCPECRKMNNSPNEIESSNVHSTMNADDSLLMCGNRPNVCCDSNNNCSTNNKEEFMVLN